MSKLSTGSEHGAGQRRPSIATEDQLVELMNANEGQQFGRRPSEAAGAEAQATSGSPKTAGDPTAAASSPGDSHIVNFYAGRSVLVTGVSGFVGKLLLEKLLRTCSGLRRVYVLIRPRKNKPASERLRELFDSALFEPLKQSFGCHSAHESQARRTSFAQFVREKVHLLEGDLTEPLLGLTGHQVRGLAGEVSVVLHSAAIVSFDKKFKRSIRTNLTGTRNVLELATKLPELEAFVYVSTCYSNCTQSEVDEHIYPVNVEPQRIIDMAECFDEETVDSLRQQLIGAHPNPYTYTKQLSEYLCGQYAVGAARLPVLICRPSIVVSTLEEPLAGYVDNRNGANGLWEAAARGMLRVVRGCPSALADQVPADVVANCVIALGWLAHLYHGVRTRLEPSAASAPGGGGGGGGEPKERSVPEEATEGARQLGDKMADYYKSRRARLAKKLALATGEEAGSLAKLRQPELLQVPVVHVSSGVENPVTFSEMFEHICAGARRQPSVNLLREPYCLMIRNRRLHALARFFQHTLVVLLLNILTSFSLASSSRQHERTSASGARRRRLDYRREFERLDKYVSLLPFFLSNSWYFNPETKVKLINDFMTGADRRLFNCHVASIDWRQFGALIVAGIRKYLWDEREDTVELARKRYRSIYWRNLILQASIVLLSCYLIYAILGFVRA